MAVALTALLGLAACVPPATVTPTPTPTEEPPAPYTGPAVFVGDELELLLLTPEEIGGIVPGATEISEPSAVLRQIADGGGAPAVPGICEILYLEQSLGSIGTRTVSWQGPDGAAQGPGELFVLQFPNEAQAKARMDQLVSAGERCGQFEKDGPVTFTAVTVEGTDNTRALAGTLIDPGLGLRTFEGFAAVGNALVHLRQPFAGDGEFDATAAANLLAARAEEARAALMEKLTVTPPTSEEEPVGDAAAPWGEWQITAGGVGPLRLGDPIDAAVAAVPGVTAEEPTYPGGPWTLRASDGAGRILVQPAEGTETVGIVTVGNDRSSVNVEPSSGDRMPVADGIRLGAPLADAVAAFPGGTTVAVSSSLDHWYEIGTRDGKVLRFRTANDATNPQEAIIGITVEDAAARGDLRASDD